MITIYFNGENAPPLTLQKILTINSSELMYLPAAENLIVVFESQNIGVLLINYFIVVHLV